MTPDSVREAVRDINEMADDPEIAHSREDTLYRELLQAIAANVADDAQECARIALTSQDIDFPRWMA